METVIVGVVCLVIGVILGSVSTTAGYARAAALEEERFKRGTDIQ